MKAACVLLLALGASAHMIKSKPSWNYDLFKQQQYNQYQRPLYRPQEQAYHDYIRQSQGQPRSSSEESREFEDAYQREWNARSPFAIIGEDTIQDYPVKKSQKPQSEYLQNKVRDTERAYPYKNYQDNIQSAYPLQNDAQDTQANYPLKKSQKPQSEYLQNKVRDTQRAYPYKNYQDNIQGAYPLQNNAQDYTQAAAYFQNQEQDIQADYPVQPTLKNKARDITRAAYPFSNQGHFQSGYSDYSSNEEIQSIFAEAKKLIKPMSAEEKTRFQKAITMATQKNNEDARLNATELLKKYDYPVEEHTVKTDDGYLLTMFRIPAKQQQFRDVTAKPVVFLMHGLLGSADDWLLMGPTHSLAYLLSDAGYDVWLGNARGNKYSRRHVTKHAALNDFWKFSTDEVALHDLPAMIDFALNTSGQEKLHYVGHAQGATVFFALAAARPAYNDKIISMHALSPMVYMSHVRSPLFRMSAPTSSVWSQLQRLIGRGAFEPNKELIAAFGGDMCDTEIGIKQVCSNVNFVMSGVSIEGVEPARVPLIVSHLPSGGSARIIKQYGQFVASGEFRKYDFGPAINSQVYGDVVPPKYNMSKVSAPVKLYSSAADWLAQPEDVARLQKELPHSESYEVPEPNFSNMDFQFSTKAPELVYKKLIESMNSPN